MIFLNHIIKVFIGEPYMYIIVSMACTHAVLIYRSLWVEAEPLISSFLCHAVLKRRSQNIPMDHSVEVMFTVMFIEWLTN